MDVSKLKQTELELLARLLASADTDPTATSLLVSVNAEREARKAIAAEPLPDCAQLYAAFRLSSYGIKTIYVIFERVRNPDHARAIGAEIEAKSGMRDSTHWSFIGTISSDRALKCGQYSDEEFFRDYDIDLRTRYAEGIVRAKDGGVVTEDSLEHAQEKLRHFCASRARHLETFKMAKAGFDAAEATLTYWEEVVSRRTHVAA